MNQASYKLSCLLDCRLSPITDLPKSPHIEIWSTLHSCNGVWRREPTQGIVPIPPSPVPRLFVGRGWYQYSLEAIEEVQNSSERFSLTGRVIGVRWTCLLPGVDYKLLMSGEADSLSLLLPSLSDSSVHPLAKLAKCIPTKVPTSYCTCSVLVSI